MDKSLVLLRERCIAGLLLHQLLLEEGQHAVTSPWPFRRWLGAGGGHGLLLTAEGHLGRPFSSRGGGLSSSLAMA
ncbi:hypothetical protein CesoFtcFv8_025221 [Champsocephalus esox]|uniref:Uncharacterized protein n=1 Tax=Champsocephalus esox TaxID=159716 RepID=A0AAN8GEM3_9TELE|nr:hypothetical protein CesoFtcFv8_025221 [Champsocephalus esox]